MPVWLEPYPAKQHKLDPSKLRNVPLLDIFAREGAPFPNGEYFLGYNEIIVDSPTWVQGLPGSVEAIFVLEGQRQDGVRDIHRRFLEAYGMNWDEFPLLMLRPGNWEKPFVALAEGSG